MYLWVRPPFALSPSHTLPMSLLLSLPLSLSLSPSLAGPLTGCLWVLKLHEIRNLLLWHNVCKEQRRGEAERDREGGREVARQLRGQALMTSRCGLRACGAKIACFPIWATISLSPLGLSVFQYCSLLGGMLDCCGTKLTGSSGRGLAWSCLDSYFGLCEIRSNSIRYLLVFCASFSLLFVCMNVFASAIMRARDFTFEAWRFLSAT